MFSKLLQFFKTLLSKINVFYQILFIIVMMIAFMTTQSIISNSAIDAIQANTKIIYTNTSGSETEDTSNIEIEIEKIRSYYLAMLTEEPTIGSTLKVNLNVLLNKIKAMKNINESTSQRLEKVSAKIKSITSEPANFDNYPAFNQAINDLQGIVLLLRNTTSSDNYNLFLDSDSFATRLKKTNFLITIIGAILTTLIGLIIASFISIPLKKMVGRIKLLETGNLSQDITSSTGSREVTQAIKGLDKAISGLRGLLTNISEKSVILDKSSVELSLVSMDTGRSAMEVARAADELATASSEQVNQITEAIDCIQKLSEMVIQVTRDSQKISDSSNQVAISAEIGQKVTNDVAAEINALFNSTKETAEVINTLISTSEEINGVTSIIEGIAEQTSLLALNASIEAARAGEHGKGFDVVAKETGKLAEQSKQSTRSISELIKQMKVRSDQAVEAIQQGLLRAESGKDLAEKATVTFQEIYKALQNTIFQIDSIVKSTKQMAINNDKATEAVTAISAISEQNMASTQEVSAVAEEQSASVEQVTALADNLRQIAGDLKQAVEMFELG